MQHYPFRLVSSEYVMYNQVIIASQGIKNGKQYYCTGTYKSTTV